MTAPAIRRRRLQQLRRRRGPRRAQGTPSSPRWWNWQVSPSSPPSGAVHLGPFDFHDVGVQTDDKIIRTSIAGVAVETLASALRALSPEDRERLVTAHAVAEAQWTWRLSISWPLPLCLRHLCWCRLGRSCLTLTTWRSFRALEQSCRRLVGAQGRGPVPPVFDMMMGQPVMGAAVGCCSSALCAFGGTSSSSASCRPPKTTPQPTHPIVPNGHWAPNTLVKPEHTSTLALGSLSPTWSSPS